MRHQAIGRTESVYVLSRYMVPRGATRLYPRIYIVPPPSLTHTLSPTTKPDSPSRKSWQIWQNGPDGPTHGWDEAGSAWGQVYFTDRYVLTPLYQSLKRNRICHKITVPTAVCNLIRCGILGRTWSGLTSQSEPAVFMEQSRRWRERGEGKGHPRVPYKYAG